MSYDRDDVELTELLESQIGEVPDTGSPEVRYPNVTVKLVGEDGNAFNLIGVVARRIRVAIGREAEKAFTTEAFDCDSYDELLAFIQRTVIVE